MRVAALECPVSGEDMKTKTIVLTLVLCFIAAAVCFADDAFTGTWKLNEAKSKIAPNAPKNNTVVYEAAGDNVKITVDGIGNDGKPTHDEWTGKFDGKDYPVTGNPNSDMRSYTKIDEHTLEFNVKKGGKITTSGRVVVSADGKSRTVTTSGTDSQGKKFKSTAVYEKQAVVDSQKDGREELFERDRHTETCAGMAFLRDSL